MILVDTSVWIRFLSNQPPYADRLEALLDCRDVVGHELILGELLIGDQGGRAEFLASYAKMHQARMVPHQDLVAFVRDRKLQGRGVGWIDIHLLASAILEDLQIWTADPHFALLAKELGIGCE
jgi:predicted nucleic acid-binding protein